MTGTLLTQFLSLDTTSPADNGHEDMTSDANIIINTFFTDTPSLSPLQEELADVEMEVMEFITKLYCADISHLLTGIHG